METPNIVVVTVPIEQWNSLNNKIDQILENSSSANASNGKEILTPKEVQDRLKIGRTTFDRYVREGILPITKISNKKSARIYVNKRELEKIIENGLI